MSGEAVKSGMTIRPATASDVPAVLPMVRALCDLHTAHDAERFRVLPDVLERYARWLPERAGDPRSVFLVAEGRAAGELAGFLVGTIEPEVPIFWVPECGWIHDIWVEPTARRAGLARGLVRGAVARFEVLGVKQIRLHTGAFNDAARATFALEGFRPCVVEMLRPLGERPPIEPIYHITTPREWESAQRLGRYEAPSLSSEGFIHASTAAQLLGTLERHYAGKTGLIVLRIDSARLTATLRWEPARGELYPHVYGAIDLEAVTEIKAAPTPWGGGG